MKLPDRLSEVRRHRKMKLQEVAELTELSVSYLSDIEHGRVNPTFKNIERIAEAYQLTVSELVAGVGRPSNISIDGLAPGLRSLIKKGWLDEATAYELNRIELEGRKPLTEEAWYGLYLYLRQVVTFPEIKFRSGFMPDLGWGSSSREDEKDDQ